MLQQLKQAVDSSILETYPHYRTAIGVLGVTLPPLLIIASVLAGERGAESSISAYYWTGMRDWFVGTLFVIGVFLFFYKYTPRGSGEARSAMQAVKTGRADAWLGKLAGIGAVCVALFPTNPPPATITQPPTIGMIHGIAAAMLFICLSLFPLLLFCQSRMRAHVYRRIGWTMVAMVVLAVVNQFAPVALREALAPWRPLLAIETVLIVLFGVSWFTKGRELAAAQ